MNAVSISTEGIVTVQARDPKTGAEASTAVSMSSGLSEEQIQEIMSRGRTADVAEGGARTLTASEPAPLLDEGEDVLLDEPSIEGEMSDLLEKRDETQLFGRLEGDLAGEDAANETSFQIERSQPAFLGDDPSDESAADDADDKLLGDE